MNFFLSKSLASHKGGHISNRYVLFPIFFQEERYNSITNEVKNRKITKQKTKVDKLYCHLF